MPPIVDAIFDLLAMLLITGAVIAVIYRLLVRRPANGEHPNGVDGGAELDPVPSAARGPFLDPVPALNTAASTEADASGGEDDGALADDPGPLVTVASYHDVERAHLARLQLEQQGVPVFVADAGVVGMAWYYSNAVHGVKVQVPERYAERAAEVLAAAEQAPAAAEQAPAPASDVGDGEQWAEAGEGAPRCPRCGSAEVYRVAKGRGVFFLLLLVLSLALPVVVRRHQCDDCGATYPYWPVDVASG